MNIGVGLSGLLAKTPNPRRESNIGDTREATILVSKVYRGFF